MTPGTDLVQAPRGHLATPVPQYTRRQIETLKRTIARGVTDEELDLFLNYCAVQRLDPFTRQVQFIRVYDANEGRMVPQVWTGIDGRRALAHRTGEYEGMDGPFWRSRDGKWKDVWDSEDGIPYACKVTVHRRGRRPFTHVALYSESVQKKANGQPNHKWSTTPIHMLAIVAERHALRKAFPEAFEGAGTDDDSDTIVIVNPDGPLTDDQRGYLFALAHDLGWDDDERHRRAGVTTFKSLTKGRAGELITEWKELLEQQRANEDPGGAGDTQATEQSASGGSRAPGRKPRQRSAPDVPRSNGSQEVAATDGDAVATSGGLEDPEVEVAGEAKPWHLSELAHRKPAVLEELAENADSPKMRALAKAHLERARRGDVSGAPPNTPDDETVEGDVEDQEEEPDPALDEAEDAEIVGEDDDVPPHAFRGDEYGACEDCRYAFEHVAHRNVGAGGVGNPAVSGSAVASGDPERQPASAPSEDGALPGMGGAGKGRRQPMQGH